MSPKVPMHDTVGVHASDCRGDIVDYIADFFFREVAALHKLIEQLPPSTKLCHNVLPLSLLENLVDLQNAGMVLSIKRTTRLLRSATSLRIMVLALANLRVFIFLIARFCFVCSCSARKTSP